MTEASVRSALDAAIRGRRVIVVQYQHVDGSEICTHRLAPIDIGGPRAKSDGQKKLVLAYSYTHRDDKTDHADPKLCFFKITHFLSIVDGGESFNPAEIIRKCRSQMKKPEDFGQRFTFCPDRAWLS